MASGPITSWQTHGETVETVTDFIFWGSKISEDCDCSHEIKRCLLLERKVITVWPKMSQASLETMICICSRSPALASLPQLLLR